MVLATVITPQTAISLGVVVSVVPTVAALAFWAGKLSDRVSHIEDQHKEHEREHQQQEKQFVASMARTTKLIEDQAKLQTHLVMAIRELKLMIRLLLPDKHRGALEGVLKSTSDDISTNGD